MERMCRQDAILFSLILVNWWQPNLTLLSENRESVMLGRWLEFALYSIITIFYVMTQIFRGG